MKVTFTTLNLPGSVIEGENPLPQLCDRVRDHKLGMVEGDAWPEDKRSYYGEDNGYKVLPYRLKDRYSRQLKQRSYRLIVLENENLRAEILPDFGGKLYALWDKRTRRDLVFRDPVIRIVNISAVDAWTAGGIEWNLGYHMHTYFAAATVYAAKLTDDEGNEFVRIYEYERMRGLYFQLDYHLPKGAEVLFTHGRVINDTGRDVFFDWWSDMGVPEEPGMRVLSGAKDVVHFQPTGKRTSAGLPYDFGYCSQDTMCKRMGFDVTYPENFKFAAEYFLESPRELRAPWLAVVYRNGSVFFNRSTDRTKNKKMYTWGRHPAGMNWRDYTVDDGAGAYIEVQSGMATTQTYTLLLKDGETWQWTESFGGTSVTDLQQANDPDISAANAYLYQAVNACITEEEIYARDALFAGLSEREPDELLVCGSGFGTLERLRREAEGRRIPRGMVFPLEALSEKELPWLELLKNGAIPELDAQAVPVSWMGADENWMKLLEKSLQTGRGRNHTALTLYGVMQYEAYDFDQAMETWKASIRCRPTAIAYRNLAWAENAAGNGTQAAEHLKKALELNGMEIDIAFAEEYLKLLVEHRQYQQAWDFSQTIPASSVTDNILLYTGLACVETGHEDYALRLFEKPLKNMREYENDSFTAEIWFKYTAIQEARKCGTACTPEFLAEIRRTHAVPQKLDYRIVE